jgi:hypothetical protein
MKQSWHIVNINTKEIVLATKKFSRMEELARSLIKLKTDHKYQIQHFIKPKGQRKEELAETVNLKDYFNG